MSNSGRLTSVGGLSISVLGTILLLSHVTNTYHTTIQDMGSIAVGYLGVIILGVSVSLTGITLQLHANRSQ